MSEERQVRPADFATPVSPWRALFQRAGAGLIGIGLVLVGVLIVVAMVMNPLIADPEKEDAKDGGQAGQQDNLLG